MYIKLYYTLTHFIIKIIMDTTMQLWRTILFFTNSLIKAVDKSQQQKLLIKKWPTATTTKSEIKIL